MLLPDSLEHNDTERQKIKDWNNIYQANSKQKKASLLIYIVDKQTSSILRNKEGHYLILKKIIILQENNINLCIFCTTF